MDILTHPHATLKLKSVDVTDFSRLASIKEQMIKLMIENHLIGLASNQIGIAERFFVVRMDTYQHDEPVFQMFVNPKIKVDKSQGVTWGWEGCASIPHKMAMVERWNKITVDAQDENGDAFTQTFSLSYARAIQHENDHVNGVTLKEKRVRQWK